MKIHQDRRYLRHLGLPGVGPEGQRRLLAARVAVVGLGGLGSPAALYMAAAGVGTLGLIDGDSVELSNLNRQILHGCPTLGHRKADSAADRIRDLNPDTRLELHRQALDADTADGLLGRYDLIVDATDNFAARCALNDACRRRGIPLVYGAVHEFEGMVSVFNGPGGPCYRCIFPEAPPSSGGTLSAIPGVMGWLTGVIGSLQAAEAVKLVLGLGQSLEGRLLVYDGLSATFRELSLDRDPACPCCSVAVGEAVR